MQDGSGMIIANHPSWKDIPLIAKHLSRHISFVAASELFDKTKVKSDIKKILKQTNYFIRLFANPISKWGSEFLPSFVERTGAIKIGKHDKYSEYFTKTKSALINNRLVCLFPGRRGVKYENEIIKRFQPGFSKIIYNLYEEGYNVPIYPTSIVWQKKNSTGLFFNTASLKIGKPVYIEDNIEENKRRTIIKFTRLMEKMVLFQINNLQDKIK